MIKLNLQLFAIDEEPEGPIPTESSITDLTGYTWVGNDSISYPNFFAANLNFTSNNNNYTGLSLGQSIDYEYSLLYGRTTVYDGGWKNSTYKTIEITGGSDVTNSTLIAWLAANGTLTSPTPQVDPYLTFSSPNSFTLRVVDNKKYWNGTLEYSTDTTTWNIWSGTTTLSSASDGTKHNLYLRGTGNTYITGSSALYTKGKWAFAGNNISCDGNIENLLDYATVVLGNHPVMANYCYSYMFSNCTSVTIPPSLPATTLASSCYANMFNACTSLTTAPSLPATTLASDCYSWMFSGTNVLPDCTNIDFTSDTVVASGGLCGLFAGTKVTDNDLMNILPVVNGHYCLPATTLANDCYSSMFRNCTSLTTAPSLPATTLANRCYYDMFDGCTSLITAPQLPATRLTNSCYSMMFSDCRSLTTAPQLPATTLAMGCYSSMFGGCTSLTIPPSLPATTLVAYCYQYMFGGCTSLTTAPSLPATTLAPLCYSMMFSGCTSLITAPQLPATTLTDSCYNEMFGYCTSLTTAPVLHATTLAGFCYHGMFYGCTSLTTLPTLPATTLVSYCYSSMFEGCTNIKLSATQDNTYTNAYRIPTTGTGPTETYDLNEMFNNTGGTFTGTPSTNTTYYTSNLVIINRTYTLIHTLTNLTKGNITLQITPDNGYTYPLILTVTNGTLVSYDNTTGVAVISGDDTTIVSGECVAQASGYNVTFTASGSWSHSPQGSVQIYDGQDNTGILLLNQTQADKSAFPMTLQVSSGYCCVYIDGLGVMGTGSSSSQDFNIVYGNPLIIGPINKNGSVDIVVEDFDD